MPHRHDMLPCQVDSEKNKHCPGEGGIVMPQKSRFTVEQKITVVTEYMSGKLSPSEFERKYGSNPRVLKDWVQLVRDARRRRFNASDKLEEVYAGRKTVSGVGLFGWRGVA